MSLKISVLGAGWLGKALSFKLNEYGYFVKASNRSAINSLEFTKVGIVPFVVDIQELDDRSKEFLDTDVLILSTTIKDLEAFQALIRLVPDSTKVISISSTSVYQDINDWVQEDSPLSGNYICAMEECLLSQRPDATIIRMGGLVGYGRNPYRFFKDGRIIANPEGYINFIHRDDCIEILHQILLQEKYGYCFNAVCDHHPTRRAFYTAMSEKYGGNVTFDSATTHYKIVNNAFLKQELQYRFAFNDLMKL